MATLRLLLRSSSLTRSPRFFSCTQAPGRSRLLYSSGGTQDGKLSPLVSSRHIHVSLLQRRDITFPGSNALVQHGLRTLEERKKKQDIKLLLSKPSHELQMRRAEIDEIDGIFEKLQNRHSNSVVSIFMLGTPACGKTQLARQYGERYFDGKIAQRKPLIIKKEIAIVGSLDMRNDSSFWRSYSRLATDLHCEVRADGQLEARLAVLKAMVQKKFQDNPGWLLIVDGVNKKMASKYEDYWPQPNSDDWGEGRVLITTSYPEIARKHDSNSYSQKWEVPNMEQNDAVSLLQNMSNIYEKGAIEVVNTPYINKNPLDIACAAIIIKEERSRNKGYTFNDYLTSMEKGEPRVEVPSSLSKAVKKLADSDSDLKLVFTAMAMCAHDPIPTGVMDRFLGKDMISLASVKECPLLLKIPEQSPPIDHYDEIPRIYTHYSTLNQFRKELINKPIKITDKPIKLQDLQRLLVKSMLEEYDQVSISETPKSKWVQQLLFRHLQQLLLYEEDRKHYLDTELKIRLVTTLSNAHIELNRNPEKSKQILTNLDKEFNTDDLNSYDKTKLDLSWAKVHRHLSQYESSALRLSAALKGIDHIHGQLTNSEATECVKECTALSLLYHSSGFDERENLSKAIRIYTKLVEEGSGSQILAEAYCGLSHLSLNMGEWSKGEEYLHEAECLIDAVKEDEIMNYSTYESLAVVYNEIGDQEKSIEILNELIDGIQKSYCLDDKPSSILSIPYARLCSAYYYSGKRDKAYEAIQKCMDCLDHTSSQSTLKDTRTLEQNEMIMRRPYFPPWTAMHIITTLLCDFGDITYPMEELIGRIESSKFEDTPLLLGRLYRHRGYYPRAEKILEEHLRERECDGYRKDSIRTGLIWAELGKVYREQGYIIRGLKAFEKAYSIYKQFYVTPNHPEVAFMQAELGRVVQLNGSKQLGIEMMKDAVDICKKHLENKTCKSQNIYVGIKYAQMLAAFGIVLRYESPSSEMSTALKYLNEALEMQDSTLHPNSIHRIRTLYYIGCAFKKMGDKERAREKMRMCQELIECQHPYKASIFTGLGRLLQKDCPDEAKELMADAFFIRKNPEQFSSEAHWKVAFAYQDLGELMKSKGSKDAAFQNFMNANDMFVRLIERESSEYEEWLDSQSSSAPDYGIDIIDRWKGDQERLRNKIGQLRSS